MIPFVFLIRLRGRTGNISEEVSGSGIAIGYLVVTIIRTLTRSAVLETLNLGILSGGIREAVGIIRLGIGAIEVLISLWREVRGVVVILV